MPLEALRERDPRGALLPRVAQVELGDAAAADHADDEPVPVARELRLEGLGLRVPVLREHDLVRRRGRAEAVEADLGVAGQLGGRDLRVGGEAYVVEAVARRGPLRERVLRALEDVDLAVLPRRDVAHLQGRGVGGVRVHEVRDALPVERGRPVAERRAAVCA